MRPGDAVDDTRDDRLVPIEVEYQWLLGLGTGVSGMPVHPTAGRPAPPPLAGGDGVATAVPRSRRRSSLGRRLLFGAADKPLSRCDDPSTCYLLVTPPDMTKGNPTKSSSQGAVGTRTYAAL